MGTLKLYGYLRSRTLNANSLVYLPSLGTFQISEIHGLHCKSDKTEDWQLLEQADPTRQETLDDQAHYDDMNAEQTWPTEQDLHEAQIKTVKKRVPKGTSDYQAAWILDSENEEDEEEEDEVTDDEEHYGGEEEPIDEEENDDEDEDGSHYDEHEEEMETITMNADKDKYDEDIDLEEEAKT